MISYIQDLKNILVTIRGISIDAKSTPMIVVVKRKARLIPVSRHSRHSWSRTETHHNIRQIRQIICIIHNICRLNYTSVRCNTRNFIKSLLLSIWKYLGVFMHGNVNHNLARRALRAGCYLSHIHHSIATDPASEIR